ncbi:BadF/BadG/BcrA/BcrD ATPase family protein [Aureimonas pseudogalii]|uniref:Glucosamine kinase n=1 Tax=Aureimonas pseudogalii TaxID=1744844 RepID=A0A7W6MLS2_9HYPH|nr:BadF/BadG/BcrA/BcrD ATPase family protein [Aureimonas pseudogalii]MBB4000064.1 glucosamine kinase [Aureimonas pseudogalii]
MRDLLLIGVDGGGTGCRARVRDQDGRLLGEVTGGATNVFTGVETALASILDTAIAALEAGGLGARDLARCVTGLGLAGANVPSVAAALHAQPLPFAAHAVETDAATACCGAFPEGEGAVAILGTGTAYALTHGGETRLLGGWGMMVSDVGSGADLGRRALAAALLAHDGVLAREGLPAALLAAFGDEPSAIAEFAKTALPRDFGGFSPLVWHHAEAGDAVALALVEEGLGVIEPMLRRCLALGVPRLALLGGLAPRYRPRIAADLAALVVQPAGDAMEGALALARSLLPATALRSSTSQAVA